MGGAHDIRGPVAPSSGGDGRGRADGSGAAGGRLAGRVGAAVSGCVTGCGGLVALALTGLVSGIFLVRDVVSTYFPVPARAVGLGWLAEQPRPTPDTHSGPAGSCTLSWRQTGFTQGRYWLSCDAARDLTLSEFVIVSGPVGGGIPYEDQRPMSGDEVHVEPGRVWTYDGTVAVGLDAVTPGADAQRAVSASFVLESGGVRETVRLRSVEPLH